MSVSETVERLRNYNTIAKQRSNKKGDFPLLPNYKLIALQSGRSLRRVDVVLSFRSLSSALKTTLWEKRGIKFSMVRYSVSLNRKSISVWGR